MDFRRRPFNQKPLVFRKNLNHPSGGPRIIWWWRDFPRKSKSMIFKETPYPVRQKIGDAGSISTQNIFPLHSATPKPPESPYGAICCLVWQTTQFFSVFQSFGPVGSSFWPNVDDVVKSTSRYGLRWICMNLPPTLVNKSPHVYLAICVWIGSATPVNRVAMHDASFMMPHSGCITLVHCFWCIMNDAWCICMGSIWDHTEINVMKLWSHFGITLWSGFVFHKNRKL
jgi:hypothetical protein